MSTVLASDFVEELRVCPIGQIAAIYRSSVCLVWMFTAAEARERVLPREACHHARGDARVRDPAAFRNIISVWFIAEHSLVTLLLMTLVTA